jgi:hypothetical protein
MPNSVLDSRRKEQAMELPEYVSKEEVKRVCQELEFRDWSEIKEPVISGEEAATILRIVNTREMDIPVAAFQQGLEVELEHGTRYEDANVTNNHPVLTGMIVLAHLKETMDYYKRIDVAEIEGDLLKAIQSRNIEKVEAKFKKLIEAQKELNQAIENQLKR